MGEEIKKMDVGTPSTTLMPKDATPKDSGKKVMKKFPAEKNGKRSFVVLALSVLVIIAGVGTGYVLAGGNNSGSSTMSDQVKEQAVAKDGADEAGIEDESQFPDTAEGQLVTGGIDGEGTHYLERDAGEEKRVYLTSTVVDLESFSGKKVQVWGQTIAAQSAPWLMDVGRIKTVE